MNDFVFKFLSRFGTKDYSRTGKFFMFFGKRWLRIYYYKRPPISDEYIRRLILQYVNVSALPPATGYMGELHAAILIVLREIDRVCASGNMRYWLDFGTLLGVIRHKGFIPWDDDADITMPRCDYEKFVDIFNHECKIPHLRAIRTASSSGRCCIIKVLHEDMKEISVDIFPMDTYNRRVPDAEKESLSNFVKTIAKKTAKRPRKTDPINFQKRFLKIRDELILQNGASDSESHPAFYYGTNFLHSHSIIFFDYETIFPLKKLKMGDCEFFVPNDCDVYLTSLYGNYMGIPNRIESYHGGELSFTFEKVLTLKRFIKGYSK